MNLVQKKFCVQWPFLGWNTCIRWWLIKYVTGNNSLVKHIMDQSRLPFGSSISTQQILTTRSLGMQWSGQQKVIVKFIIIWKAARPLKDVKDADSVY